MISGTINSQQETTISLEIQGIRRDDFDVVVDTGFNGYLTLPKHIIDNLGLLRFGQRRVALGDGSVVPLVAYLATVSWHSVRKEVLVLQADGSPLLGMSLLYGNKVLIDVVKGGKVSIAELS
jgi:clan AA aspartic protease